MILKMRVIEGFRENSLVFIESKDIRDDWKSSLIAFI